MCSNDTTHVAIEQELQLSSDLQNKESYNQTKKDVYQGQSKLP